MTTTTADLSASDSETTLDSGLIGIRWVFPDVASTFTPFESDRATIGRGATCALAVDGRGISREHAEISRERGVYWIRDLRSRNGTVVNGVRQDATALTLGDVIRLGDVVGVFTESSASAAQRSPFEHLASGLVLGPVLRSRISSVLGIVTTDLPVLLMGETGAGKEVIARAVHELSRRTGPYRAINCAALPEALAEGELFGYRKGAYTGASSNHRGHLREADRGTLLLDEIADLPLAIQAKLLRTLETREVQPLGQAEAVRVDVRIVAATATDLRVAVSQQRFRADLLARFNGVSVTLPPLRERREEIVHLFYSLIRRHSKDWPGISAGVAEQLCLYGWPQNVRELAFSTQRITALFGSRTLLRRHHLRVALAASQAAPPPQSARTPVVDAASLMEAIRAHDGNLARAASTLHLSRGRAYRLLREAGLQSDRRRC